MDLKQEALRYHEHPVPGKISVVPSKPCQTQKDLSLAYTPGVAQPVLEIEKNPEDAYRYTSKGNLVAVISNGTAILGLGDRGPLASKPVMEGKGVLFKRFADVDVFDIELDEKDPKKIIAIVKALEPTFGGINLEDIKAPECFEIEEELKKICKIPVFHDDQHGTAIISAAGLINVCELTGKKPEDIIVVCNGAGAAGIACMNLYIVMGVKRSNIIMCDTKGVVFRGRTEGMNKYKEAFACVTKKRTLADALEGADVFLGVSSKDCVTPEMVKSMNSHPVIFAMANPDPEITPEAALAARNDVIMATGRSDYPNQINNVLGFPFIFRGALDVRASCITEGMKLAASKALAALAKEPVPDVVSQAYGGKKFSFGPEYIVPKPFDPRVIEWVTVAVAKQACIEGVAAKPITDWDKYREQLKQRVSQEK
jgi:malate dehydrogenase (oxaloacetate-decarboxylating)(NADP+)